MSALVEYAKNELNVLGLGVNDQTGESYDYAMRSHILHMVEEFSKEGHSGFSASYALSILKRVLDFKPLSPLTGEDDEWNQCGFGDEIYYQNKRASSVFKDANGAYWSDGIVFWEWHTDPDTGEKYKSHFTSKDSRVRIESFPWTMPDAPEYREYINED